MIIQTIWPLRMLSQWRDLPPSSAPWVQSPPPTRREMTPAGCLLTSAHRGTWQVHKPIQNQCKLKSLLKINDHKRSFTMIKCEQNWSVIVGPRGKQKQEIRCSSLQGFQGGNNGTLSHTQGFVNVQPVLPCLVSIYNDGLSTVSKHFQP